MRAGLASKGGHSLFKMGDDNPLAAAFQEAQRGRDFGAHAAGRKVPLAVKRAQFTCRDQVK